MGVLCEVSFYFCIVTFRCVAKVHKFFYIISRHWTPRHKLQSSKLATRPPQVISINVFDDLRPVAILLYKSFSGTSVMI